MKNLTYGDWRISYETPEQRARRMRLQDTAESLRASRESLARANVRNMTGALELVHELQTRHCIGGW